VEKCSIEYEDGFTFLKPKAIECRIVTCQHYETCSSVGKAGILPKAKYGFEEFDWQLPGHGSAYDDCGAWRYRGCLNVEGHVQSEISQDVQGKIYVEWYHRSCRRAECPVCYEKWAGKEAAKIEHRLKYFWKYNKVLHITISPSEKDALKLSFEQLKAKMYRTARLRGIKGGCVIWHDKRDNYDGTWRISGHFHVLGFGWVRNVSQGFKSDGWLVKNIPDGSRERSVFQTALYQLSHCGTSKKHRPVSWFGVCSSKIKVPEMEEEKHVCPGCGAELVQLRYFGLEEALPDREENKSAWLDPGDWVEIQKPRYEGG
jgi:hypothetical protein